MSESTNESSDDTNSIDHSTPDLYDTNFPSLSSSSSFSSFSSSSSSFSTTTINYSSIVNTPNDVPNGTSNANDTSNSGGIVKGNLELAESQHLQNKRFHDQKNQAARIIKRTMERTNTRISIDNGAKKSLVNFIIEGKDKDVADAKRILTDKLGIKVIKIIDFKSLM